MKGRPAVVVLDASALFPRLPCQSSQPADGSLPDFAFAGYQRGGNPAPNGFSYLHLIDFGKSRIPASRSKMTLPKCGEAFSMRRIADAPARMP